MGDDTVRHGVGGDMGFVVADVGDMRSLLGLVVSEDDGGTGRGLCDVRDELRICVDDTLRVAFGLCSAIAHDPGSTG
jgi:hypothetical protein